MTSDLPFDSDATDGADPAGDTAYRVATGVARVARAGAYVTGGALVAANGGTAPSAPSAPGGQRLDSWATGWSHDPHADVPSPVVTFPDPGPDWTPPSGVGSPSQVAAEDDGGHPFQLPSMDIGASLDGLQPNESAMSGPSWQDSSYGDFGELDRDSALDSLRDEGVTGLAQAPVAPSTGLPGDLDFGQGFGLPGQSGHGFGLPDTNGFLAPGSNPFGLSRVPTASEKGSANEIRLASGKSGTADADDNHDAAAELNPFRFDSDPYHFDSDPYHGVGGDSFGLYFGGEASLSIRTELDVDFGIGSDGMYLTTASKVDVDAGMKIETGAGRVGDNLDKFSDWLGGTSTPGTHGRSGLDQSGTASGSTSPVGGVSTSGVATPGVATPGISPVPHASVPHAVQPMVVQPVAAQPAAQPFAAPVASAAVPVVPVVAPAAVAAPVAATPLQTTIQPDAATTPIANVIVAPTGASPLTAPAAAVPALFEQPVKPPAAPVVVDESSTTPTTQAPTTQPSLTGTPATITATVPVPVTPGSTVPDSGLPTKTPDLGVTKTPGAGGTTRPDTDVITKTPGATVTQQPTAPQSPDAPSHTAPPSTPDDVTTPSTIGGAPSTYPQPSVDTQPSVDIPSVQPTVSVPTQSIPTQPHTQPSVDIDIPTMPAPPPTMHNPAPLTPIKPISADLAIPVDYTHQSMSGTDHSAMTMLASGGLSSTLLPAAETHHAAADVPDFTLI